MISKYELHEICKCPLSNSIDEIKECLINGADINLVDEAGNTPLYYAVQSGESDIVEYLLDSKADPNKFNPNIIPPLVFAAGNNLYKIVLALLKHPDININQYGAFGATALYAACQNGYTEIVDLLLDKGADPTICKSDTHTSPLIIAVGNQHISIVEKLCEKAPKLINLETKDNTTPLHIAAIKKSIKSVFIALILIKNGAKIDALTTSNVTPLYLAAEANNEEIVHLLLQHHSNYLKKMGTIKEKGAEAIPLTIAACSGHLNIVELLLQYPHPDKLLTEALHQVMMTLYRSSNSEKRQVLYDISERLKQEIEKKPERRILTVYDNHKLTWDASYKEIFEQFPSDIDRQPKNENAAIRYALTCMYQFLSDPETWVSYIKLLSDKIDYQWEKENDGKRFPKFDQNMIDFWAHEGMLWPVPNEQYQGVKRFNLLEHIIYDKFKEHEMGAELSKWTGFIPKNKSSELLFKNSFFTENRKTISGLLHGNMHNIQRFVLLCAIEEGKIPLSYKTDNGYTQCVKPKDIFSALMRKDIFPDGNPHRPLWIKILDFDHYEHVTFSHPQRLQSMILSHQEFSGTLQDYMLFSFCNEFIKLRNLLNHVYGKTYTNKEMCHELKKIPSGSFGLLPEFAIQWDEKKNLEQVETISQLKIKGRFWNIQPKVYKPFEESIKQYKMGP